MNHINHKSVSEDNKYIVDIVQIIGRQGSVEIDMLMINIIMLIMGS